MSLEDVDKMGILVRAIEAHAQPRAYDWLLLVLTAVSIIFSFIAICSAIKIARRQDDIALLGERDALLESVLLLRRLRDQLYHHVRLNEPPDSADSMYFFVSRIKVEFDIQEDFDVLLKLHEVKDMYEKKIPRLFTKVNQEEIVADINRLIDLLERYYSPKEFDLEKLGEDEFLLWFKGLSYEDEERIINSMEKEIKVVSPKQINFLRRLIPFKVTLHVTTL